MLDLTQVAVWAQIISVPLAIVTIVVSVWIFRRSTQKREISCSFGDILLPIEVRTDKNMKGEIEISYNGKPIDNLFIIRAFIKNTGNLSILKSHIFQPLTVEFGSDMQLLQQPRIVYTKPANIKSTWHIDQPTLDLKPTRAILEFDLLNAGDELTTDFICTGKSKLPEVSVRIDGMKQMGPHYPGAIQLWSFIAIAILILTIPFFVVSLLIRSALKWLLVMSLDITVTTLSILLALLLVRMIVGWLITRKHNSNP